MCGAKIQTEKSSPWFAAFASCVDKSIIHFVMFNLKKVVKFMPVENQVEESSRQDKGELSHKCNYNI